MGAFPKHIIQVFRSFRQYGKEENNPDFRSGLADWPRRIVSSSGYLEDETVFLNSAGADLDKHLEQSSVVVLIDRHPEESHPLEGLRGSAENEWYALLGRGEEIMRYELFDLTSDGGAFELFLNYSEHALYIGRPRRDDFKVADLRKQEPVRVTINGKSDATLAGRRARTYNFYDYIFVYLGVCRHVRTLPLNRVQTEKPVPAAQAKRVDLTKVLY